MAICVGCLVRGAVPDFQAWVGKLAGTAYVKMQKYFIHIEHKRKSQEKIPIV
jgi:hypothetical protein